MKSGKNIFSLKIICLILSVIFAREMIYSQAPVQKPMSENPATLKKHVTDETGTLTPSELSALNLKLSGFEKVTSNQLVVYIIPSLDGESLEDVSIRIAEKNKIGKKDKNNGVLLLIVKNDRKIRIEVGYGLEGALTDAISSRIIRNDIAPAFKKGKFFEGINAGVDAIILVTKGEYKADTEEEKKLSGSGECCFGIPIFVAIIFMIIFFFIITSFIRSLFGVGKSMHTGKKGNWSSGWGSGSWSSGSRSSGFGGGGFSGGGGSFGGGGASGGW